MQFVQKAFCERVRKAGRERITHDDESVWFLVALRSRHVRTPLNSLALVGALCCMKLVLGNRNSQEA
jgi:hypothetical protein